MKLPPFLLDRWLDQKFSANPPIEFDLGSSTGPVWTLRELLALSEDHASEWLLDTPLSYTTAAGSNELREAIGELEGVNSDEVQVVTGAAEALLILFFLAAEPDANVVLPSPGFPANRALTESLKLESRYYTLRPQNEFRIDLNEIRGLVDGNTRFVLVNSPHNPTGSIISDQQMKTLHDFCAERGIQFVSDQVYHPIYHGASMKSAARLPHATVIGDFSKALCLSGLRVGWMIEHDPNRREQYTDARSYFTVSNTVLGESLAVLALQHHETIYERVRRVATANLALVERVFTEHRDILRWVRPQGGMTTFPWLADRADAREFCRRLMKRGVMLAPGDCFGMPAHFRLGFAATGDRFPLGLERFAEFLRTDARERSSASIG
jgi:aspartate/methionine/tyrosine aminotransferase